MHIIHVLANRSLSSHAIYLASEIFCVEVIDQSDKDNLTALLEVKRLSSKRINVDKVVVVVHHGRYNNDKCIISFMM